MNWNGRRESVWAYAAPADLRKGFDGLRWFSNSAETL
jgi:hypothetical protein